MRLKFPKAVFVSPYTFLVFSSYSLLKAGRCLSRGGNKYNKILQYINFNTFQFSWTINQKNIFYFTFKYLTVRYYFVLTLFWSCVRILGNNLIYPFIKKGADFSIARLWEPKGVLEKFVCLNLDKETHLPQPGLKGFDFFKFGENSKIDYAGWRKNLPHFNIFFKFWRARLIRFLDFIKELFGWFEFCALYTKKQGVLRLFFLVLKIAGKMFVSFFCRKEYWSIFSVKGENIIKRGFF